MSLDKTLIGALNLLREHRDSIEQTNAMPDGRVHDAEARADVERHEAACAAIRDAISVLQMERSQHDADTRELCSLRTERDAARRQRDNWKFAHDGWQPAAEYVQGLSNAGVLPARMLGMHCGDALIALVEQLRGDCDELAARLAEIEAQPPVAWQSRFTDGGGWADCSERHARMVAATPDEWPGYEVRTLIARPAPAAAPVLEPVHGDLLPPVGSTVWIRHGRDDDAHECTVLGYYAWGDLGGNRRLSRVFVRVAYARRDGVNARMLCDCWPSRDAALAAKPVQAEAEPATCCKPVQARMSIGDALELHAIADGTKIRPAAAPERAEPADPRTPPPGCRLLGDYEPAQAGDMAYIGAIAGRWRRVKPRMGIIGATMDELSDGARVLALARPCRCGPDGCSDSVACPKGGAA